MNFFKTFRGKLLIILVFLLVATLGVQYYLNLQTQNENSRRLRAQTQALVAGFALATNGLTSREYMEDLVEREGQTFFGENVTRRIKNVLIIDNNWRIFDSLDAQYAPTTDENGNPKYVDLQELKNLPPLMEAARLGEDSGKFPNVVYNPKEPSDGEAHAVPVQTSEGRYYVMVILENDTKEVAARAAQPLVYTLGVLLLSGLTTFYLVWRFTRPIANLSEAARRVADGDLGVRVEVANRSDEMGELASRFNEMTAELAKNRELEARFQEAEKSAVVGRLASAIAHEIRNPLNYINLTLDHLRNKFKPDADAKRETFEKLTAQLKKEVARINNQISDFLRYSRPLTLNLQPTDARAVIEDSLHIVEPQAEDQNIAISVVERENVPPILADAEFLRSVFSNLFINAVQAMQKQGGNLNVTISPDTNSVKIEIADTGCGIEEENVSKIFEPYFSTKDTGTGLGLAIVKKIVDDHNGTIAVESASGEGTVFTVTLPRV